jgi:hypothetical protein
MVVSYGDVQATRGRLRSRIGRAVDDFADADSLTLALLDDQTLRALQPAAARQLGRLAAVLRDDPTALARLAGRADLLGALQLARGARALDLELAFLQRRLQQAGAGDAEIDRLLAALREAGIGPARLPGVPDAALQRLASPVVLDQLEAVGALQKRGRIRGLADWIEAAKTGATDPTELALELREALRQTREKPAAILHIGGDHRAPMRPGTTEKMQSFDMTAESSSGKVTASIEVTSVKEPLYRPAGIGAAFDHGVDKLKTRIADKAPIPGEHELTILAELGTPTTKNKKGGSRSINPTNGDMLRVTAEKPPRTLNEGNLYASIAVYLSKIPNEGLLHYICLIDRKSGAVLARFRRNKTNIWEIAK